MDKIINYFNLNNSTISFTNNQDLIKINSLLNNLNSELGIDNKIKNTNTCYNGKSKFGKSSLLDQITKIKYNTYGTVMETRTPII